MLTVFTVHFTLGIKMTSGISDDVSTSLDILQSKYQGLIQVSKNSCLQVAWTLPDSWCPLPVPYIACEQEKKEKLCLWKQPGRQNCSTVGRLQCYRSTCWLSCLGLFLTPPPHIGISYPPLCQSWHSVTNKRPWKSRTLADPLQWPTQKQPCRQMLSDDLEKLPPSCCNPLWCIHQCIWIALLYDFLCFINYKTSQNDIGTWNLGVT